MRFRGCPVSVTESLLVLAGLAEAENPTRDWRGISSYLQWKWVMALERLRGHRYRIHGETELCAAKPELVAS